MEAVSREAVRRRLGEQQAGRQTLRRISIDSRWPETSGALLRELLTSVATVLDAGGRRPAPAQSARGITLPYAVNEEAVTLGTDVPYNGYAHSFAGMGIQFLLFAMIDLGVGILLERQRGLWKRLRSAPISRQLAARAARRSAASLDRADDPARVVRVRRRRLRRPDPGQRARVPRSCASVVRVMASTLRPADRVARRRRRAARAAWRASRCC